MNSCPSKKNILKAIDEENYILITLQNKYGDTQYIVTTENDFVDCFLEILKERYESCHYYYNPEKDEPVLPSLTEKEAKSLPDGRPKQAALEDLENYHKQMLYHKDNIKEWGILQQALKEKDGWKAYMVLARRSYNNHEYEGVNVSFVKKYRTKKNGTK